MLQRRAFHRLGVALSVLGGCLLMALLGYALAQQRQNEFIYRCLMDQNTAEDCIAAWRSSHVLSEGQ